MKNKILSFAVTVCIAGTILSSCQSSANKVENAQENLQDAKEDVTIARNELNEALSDSIQQFKRESQEKISNYESSIAEFKIRIANEKKENKAIYDKKLAEIERKNSDLKMRLDEYKEDGQERWTAFKEEFNHDMNEIGKALKEVTVNSKK